LIGAGKATSFKMEYNSKNQMAASIKNYKILSDKEILRIWGNFQ